MMTQAMTVDVFGFAVCRQCTVPLVKVWSVKATRHSQNCKHIPAEDSTGV